MDFGRAEVVVAGVRHKAALFVLTLPYSNARFGCLFPRECTETFHEGHARAFAFFGGVASTYGSARGAARKGGPYRALQAVVIEAECGGGATDAVQVPLPNSQVPQRLRNPAAPEASLPPGFKPGLGLGQILR